MLRWKEPSSYKRAIARRNGEKPNRWYPLLFALGVVVVFLVGAAFHNQPAIGSWPLTVALAAGCGAMIAYGVPFIADRRPVLACFRLVEHGFAEHKTNDGARNHKD